MKTLLLLLSLVSLGTSAHQYEGSWYFINGSYLTQEGATVNANNQTTTAIKQIKGSNFTLINLQNGQYNGYLSGKFIIDKQGYREQIINGTSDAHINKAFKFKGWIEEKTINNKTYFYWHHQGVVNGTLEKEVWRKLEPKVNPI